MKIFLSWSGDRSKLIAEILHGWLPLVIQAVKPWLSASDIDKGTRWSSDIASKLEETSFGIICLTPENLDAPWILFEAGALSKTIESSFVCPYLFDVDPSDMKGPLVQFQTTRGNKEDTLALIHTINCALPESLPEKQIDKSFEVWWPDLEEKLQGINKVKKSPGVKRSDRDLLEEVLELARKQAREKDKMFEQLQLDVFAPDDAEMNPDWPIGTTVKHSKFGRGTVRKVEGFGNNTKVVVWFDQVGPKKLLVRFAGLEKI